MKTVITLFFFFLIHATLAQFHRSFLNTHAGVSVLKTKLVVSDDDSIRFAHIRYSTISDPVLKISTVSKSGDLLHVKNYSFTLSNISGNDLYISAIFQRQNSFIVCLFGHTNTVQRFAVVDINRFTAQVNQSYTVPIDFKSGYSEAVILNNEIVNYVVKNTGGLYRISTNLSSFSNTTEELVDNGISSAGGFSSLLNAKRFSQTILFQGKELTAINQTSNLGFYSRDLPGTFSLHSVGSTIIGGIGLLNENDTSFVVLDANTFYRLNANYTTTATNTYNTIPSISIFQTLRRSNGDYFVSLKAANNQNYIQKFNPQFQLIEQRASYQISLGTGVELGGLTLFYGICDRLTVDLNEDGQSNNQKTIALLAIADTLDYNPIEEYNYPVIKDQVLFNAGIADKAINQMEGNYSAAKYNNRQTLMATLCQIHEGKLINGDTVGKPNGPFDSQSRVGPYTTPTLFDDVIEAKYNRGFYVTRKMIEAHIDSIQSNSATYVAPRSIRDWPGNGDVTKGQAARIAGFVDLNSNGTYEPYLGEYPLIYGDACLLQISHDHPNLSHPGGVENHTYFYSYDCDSTDYLNNTIFIKMKYFLRTQSIQDFGTGFYVDFDNGDPTDDYAGTHVELAMIYNYNSDMWDENFSSQPGFKDTLIAQGLMVLRGNKLDNDGIDNPFDASPTGCTNGINFGDGIVDNEYHTLERSFAYSSIVQVTDPFNVQDWYNVSQGFWSDGSPQFYGASGNMNFGSTTPYKSRFVYPGGSDTLQYGTAGFYPGFDWSEYEPNGPGSTSNPPNDRRMYSYQGTSTINQGDSVEIDLAYVLAVRPNNGSDSITSILSDLFTKADLIKKAYNSNSLPCGGNFNPIENDLSVAEANFVAPLVYPNPSSGVYFITGLNAKTATLHISDVTGKVILSQEITEQEPINLTHFEGNLFFATIEVLGRKLTYKLLKM